MKVVILLILVVVFCNIEVKSQSDFKFPDGVYLTHDQFKNRTPAFNTELKTIIRTSGEIFMIGGNLYKFESKNDSLNKDFIKNKIYAYVKNDSVFVNGKHHKLQSWYALAVTYGNFVVVSSGVKDGKAIGAAMAGGLIGSALVSGNDHLFVISLRTGNCRELDVAYLKGRLKEHPGLLEEYENEEDQKSQQVLIKYINKLNDVTDPMSKAPEIAK